jgi:DNA-binding winged helix-turn-helix (wHTH) protein/tetratricopeptide (TPR) repeat protein
MATSANQREKVFYEFGPFRVDAEREMVLRAGCPVPLTPKAFHVLLVLVRNGTEMVSKEDLLKTIWPDTFVEEGNLSRQVFMLRKALGEGPQDHRYIVTIPGRGYRLAETVRVVPQEENTLVVATHSEVKVQVTEHRTWLWLGWGLVVVLGVLAAVGYRLIPRRNRALSPQDTLVLADFANSTGDPVFDGTLRRGMAVALDQSSFLSLVSEVRIRHTLSLMGMPANTRLTPELARQVCERLGSAAVLDGAVARIGAQYVLSLHAANCDTGATLDDEQEQVGRKEDILNALSHIATRFRRRAGESLAAIESHNKPLAEATTPSLDALKAYSTAWEIHYRSGTIEAVPLLRRAIELDPGFAMAYASLGRMYDDLDQSDLAAQYTEKAWQLRDRASERERFFITVGYQQLTLGNQERTRQTAESWAQMYPRDALAHSFLSGMANKVAGRFDTAAVEARKAVELDPDFAIGYLNLALNNAYMNRLNEAESALREGDARGLAIDEFFMLRYDIGFLRGDDAAMRRVADAARQRDGTEGWITNDEAFAAAFSGHLQQARSLTTRAVRESLHVSQQERAALWLAGAAEREALLGDRVEARRWAALALTYSSGREVEFGAAFALALAGETARAQSLAADLDKRYPEDTLVQFEHLPTIRALVALKRNNPAQAIQALQNCAPYELSPPRALIGALYPVYVRGLAYLAERRGTEATQQFQKILDHSGIVVSDPIGVLAYVQLARAYALLGDIAKARSSYQDFLSLWKDADPDIPILQQVRAEYVDRY